MIEFHLPRGMLWMDMCHGLEGIRVVLEKREGEGGGVGMGKGKRGEERRGKEKRKIKRGGSGLEGGGKGGSGRRTYIDGGLNLVS